MKPIKFNDMKKSELCMVFAIVFAVLTVTSIIAGYEGTTFLAIVGIISLVMFKLYERRGL